MNEKHPDGRQLTLHEHRRLRAKKRTLADAREMRFRGAETGRKAKGRGGIDPAATAIDAWKKMVRGSQSAADGVENTQQDDALLEAGAFGWELGGGNLIRGGMFLSRKAIKGIGHAREPEKNVGRKQKARMGTDAKGNPKTGKKTFAKRKARQVFARKKKAKTAQQSAEAARRTLIKAEQMSKQAAKSAAAAGKGLTAALLKLTQLAIKFTTMLIGLLMNFLVMGGWLVVLILLVVILVVLFGGSADFSKDFDADSRGKYYVSDDVTLEDYIQSANARWVEGLFAELEDEAVLVFYGTGSGELAIDWDACMICFAVYCEGAYMEGNTLEDEEVAALDAMIPYFAAYEQETATIDFSAPDPADWQTADGIWNTVTKAKLSSAPEGEQLASVVMLLEPDWEQIYQVFDFDASMQEECDEALGKR
ncbi:MAG: hypothetical protein Q4C48_10860 [Lachnospiraceae bacterium]|nr:hypothetical protein [Lachnospiraceae bacterium]